ncbi:hypothetical protein NA56DRAFT_710377 [Hyaloscypha hepaticicola]|uniref:Uncharacterized protein n=1 Tax=Hyaloscypha hepaticicola TaxID=2082293 RepID=A0A2J6PLP6_9HELO|nr:hypothetical protein NA56DRAFT_710377 [Hyaloscypha hepaticicola]
MRSCLDPPRILPPCPRRRTITTLSVIAIAEALPWHCFHAFRPGQSKKCLTTTWLASAWLLHGITCRGKDLGPISAYVAVAEDNLYNNCIIKASVKHPAEPIRNTDSGRTGEKRGGDVDDHRQADRITSGGALSEAIAYWKAGSGA